MHLSDKDNGLVSHRMSIANIGLDHLNSWNSFQSLNTIPDVSLTESKGFLEMLEQIKYEDSPNVPNNGLFSDELRNFVDICLQKEPSDR